MREITAESLKKKIEILNPHWRSGSIDSATAKLGRRDYFNLFFPLVRTSTVRRAVILLGPRRVGKTIMLQQVIQRLIEDGVEPKKVVYFSIDTPLLQGLPLEELLNLYLDIHDFESSEDCYVIFDEIQYLKDWEIHLKALVDGFKKTKFIGSGSAAAALKRKSQESGAGRFTDFMLPPVTFYEYLKLLGLEGALGDSATLNEEFIRYMNFGGYPEALFSAEIQQNPERFVRSDIIEKALLRDLPSLYGIDDIQEFTRLFNTLAYQTGNEVTLEGLSKSSGVAKNTINRYIEYLESAFLIKTVSRVDNGGKSFKRENFFKVYLTNPSMYAALIEPITPDCEAIGSLVETAVYSQLIHDTSAFDRTVYARWNDRRKGQGEIDLVRLNERLKVAGAIEVKWTDRFYERPRELTGVLHFCEKCGLKDALVTTQTQHGTKNINGINIRFLEAALVCYELGKLILQQKHALHELLARLSAADLARTKFQID